MPTEVENTVCIHKLQEYCQLIVVILTHFQGHGIDLKFERNCVLLFFSFECESTECLLLFCLAGDSVGGLHQGTDSTELEEELHF